jgi:8-oxo-dGTP diphosphatase
MKKQAVAILLENKDGKILFLLRDNKSTIKCPNMWDVLGGVVENIETPEEAIVREMKEELGLNLKKFQLFKVYDWPEKIETVFHKKLSLNVNKTNLNEGQKIRYFSKDELLSMNLAFHDNRIIRDFFNK